MQEKQYNDFIKLLMIVTSTILVTICLILYLGDENMKKEFEFNYCFKIGIILFFLALIAMLAAICIAIFKNSDKSNSFIFDSNTKYIILKSKSNREYKKYENLESCFENIDDNDLLVVLDDDFEIDFDKLFIINKNSESKKSISLTLGKSFPVFKANVKTQSLKKKKDKTNKTCEQ